MSDKNNIQISESLFDLIKQKVEGSSDFDSVDSYVEYVLQEIFKTDEPEYNQEDEEQIRKHLKDMGYV